MKLHTLREKTRSISATRRRSLREKARCFPSHGVSAGHFVRRRHKSTQEISHITDAVAESRRSVA